VFKEVNVSYDKCALLKIANSLEYTRAYEALGREIPQEIFPNFGLAHPLVKEIVSQLPKVKFYNSSFIRTTPNTKINPHVDSSGLARVKRTVNFLFPLANYNSPLTIEDSTFEINGPVAFRCDLKHSYENNTNDYRTAFILQVRYPYTFDRLIEIGAL
jgi:hypothetical protein